MFSTTVYESVLPSPTVRSVGKTVTPGGSATVTWVSPRTGSVIITPVNMIPVISYTPGISEAVT